MLRSCENPRKNVGVESGAKGCVPPTLTFVIADYIGKKLTKGKVIWEKPECGEMAFEIAEFKTTTIEYTAKCGKLKTIEGVSDGIGACTKFETDTAQPIPAFYIKKDGAACMFVAPGTAATYVTTNLGANPGSRSFNMSTVGHPVSKYEFFETPFQVREAIKKNVTNVKFGGGVSRGSKCYILQGCV